MNGILPRTRTPEELRFARDLSDWIRRVRVNLALSHGQLGEVAGVIATTMQRWEQGESMPKPDQLYRLRAFARTCGQEVPEL